MSAETLLPDVAVAGRNIRPWALGQLVKVGPHLADLLGIAEQRGLDLGPMIRNRRIKDEDQVRFAQVILAGLPAVVELLIISLNEPREKVEALDIAVSIALVKAVFIANQDHLKNSLAPLLAGAAIVSEKKT